MTQINSVVTNKTSEEALQLIEEIGHQATILTKIDGDEHYILNRAVVYIVGKKPTSGSNKSNAEEAIKEIKKYGGRFEVRSDVFSWAIGEYRIVD